MANDLTTHSKPQPLSLPSGLSSPALAEALNGRCNQERLLRGIRDLLGLYWQPNDTPEERARQALLFVRDLAEFSDDVVDAALSEWRRQHDRRPTIAGLRQLCMARRYGLTEEAKRRSPPEPEPQFRLSDEERARRREQIAMIMKETGFAR
jgi:hypothetical protein